MLSNNTDSQGTRAPCDALLGMAAICANAAAATPFGHLRTAQSWSIVQAWVSIVTCLIARLSKLAFEP